MKMQIKSFMLHNHRYSFAIAHVLIFFIVFWLLASTTWATDYFILPYDSAHVNGNGLSQYRPISKDANGAWNGIRSIDWSKIKAGDSVLFKKGEVYFEQLTVSKSGEIDHPISFKSFGSGPNPIITGGKKLSQQNQDWVFDSKQLRWICSKFEDGSSSNKIYNAAIVDDMVLERSYSPDFLNFYGNFSNASFRNTIFLDQKPWLHEIFVSVLAYNLLIENKSYIDFSEIDFSLSNGWSPSQFANIHIINSHHISFKGCRTYYGALSGTWVISSNYITFDNCDIFDNYCTGLYFREGSSYANILNCRIYRNGKYLSANNATDTGALLMGSSGTGTGHLIKANTFYDNGRKTITDRVDGTGPENCCKWIKVSSNLWRKDLSNLKRWSGLSESEGVHFFGKNNLPMEQAPSDSLCTTEQPWFWDRKTQSLYYLSKDNPNETSDLLEIAWYNVLDPAIALWGITNSTISNNEIKDNYSSGIGATYKTSMNLTISGNIITGNILNNSQLCIGMKYGLLISGQGGHIVTDNIIRNNGIDDTINSFINAGLLITASSIAPLNNLEISNNSIQLNAGYQISWQKYLGGDVLNNIKCDNNAYRGKKLFNYLGNEYQNLSDYKSVSGFDLNSAVLEKRPKNFNMK